MVGNCYQDCQLFLGSRVFSFVCFGLECQSGLVVGCAWFVKWVAVSSQFDHLGNGPKGCLDATSLDLLPSSVCSFLHPSSKDLQDHKSLWHIQFLKVWMDIWWKKVAPVLPIMVPGCLCQRHNSSFDVGIDSMEMTHPIVFCGRWQKIQDLFCGGGK